MGWFGWLLIVLPPAFEANAIYTVQEERDNRGLYPFLRRKVFVFTVFPILQVNAVYIWKKLA